MDFFKRHATGSTIVLFLLGVLVLSALPVPSWMRPLDALHQDDPFRALVATIFHHSESAPRKSDAAGGDWALAEETNEADSEDDKPRPELAIVPPHKRQPWSKPERPKLESMRKPLGLFSAPIEINCKKPIGATDDDCKERALDRFVGKLLRAAEKEQDAIVRVVHYGDSIIASDHITDVVRTRLQERFGSAGKGFLLITRYNARQRRLRTGAASKGWRTEHIAQGKLADRNFGYAGSSFIAEKAGEESVFSDVGESRTAAIYYLEHPEGGTLEIWADDKLLRTLETKSPYGISDAKIAELQLPEGTQAMKLKTRGKNVRLFGVSLEARVPGVIYESIGIPGATSEVWLYPDPRGFEKQLVARDPSLIITMLGGNDARALHQKKKTLIEIEKSTRAFLARLEESAPGADCMVVSPMDAVEAKASGEMKSKAEIPEVLAVQKRVAKDMGCAFWDMYASMGGSGSLERWVKAGLINPDLIHPRAAGADLLGELLAEALMDAYDARIADLAEAEENPEGLRPN
jgi:lysophospholipase L1-like esterase